MKKEENTRPVLALLYGGRRRLHKKQADHGGSQKQERRFQTMVVDFKRQKEEDTTAKCKKFQGQKRKAKIKNSQQ